MTRSGRIFSDPAIQLKAEAVAKAKGKKPMKQPDMQNANPDLEKDIEEIMKFIRKSDLSVIDQLAQTPAKISILSLLRDSEVHRNALMKLLSTDFVPQEISVGQFENVCASISASNGLGFTDFDLPPEGQNHNKVLHIFM